MTSITAGNATVPSTQHSLRRSFAAFVAGLALAGTLALGIIMATDSSPSAKPASSAVSGVGHASAPAGCTIVHGPC